MSGEARQVGRGNAIQRHVGSFAPFRWTVVATKSGQVSQEETLRFTRGRLTRAGPPSDPLVLQTKYLKPLYVVGRPRRHSCIFTQMNLDPGMQNDVRKKPVVSRSKKQTNKKKGKTISFSAARVLI